MRWGETLSDSCVREKERPWGPEGTRRDSKDGASEKLTLFPYVVKLKVDTLVICCKFVMPKRLILSFEVGAVDFAWPLSADNHFQLKNTTHLDHISHSKAASGTNWSNRWTYRVFTINPRDTHFQVEQLKVALSKSGTLLQVAPPCPTLLSCTHCL